MYISNATLDALRTTFSALFETAYQAEVPTFYQEISTEVGSKTAKNVYGWIAQQLVINEWVGPRIIQNLSEHEYEIPNKKYEGTIQLQREKVEDDNLDDFQSQAIPQLARAVKKHPDDLIIAAIQGNVTAFDGLSLFNTAHPTFNGTGTYSNDFTETLDGDGFQNVVSAMASIMGEDGKPLELSIDTLIVPTQRKRDALIIMQSTTYAIPGTTGVSATVDNPLKGWANVVEAKRLNNQPLVWYAACTSFGIKPFVYQKRTEAEFVARDNPADPGVFDNDIFTYGTRQRDAIGPTLPFLIARSTQS